MLPKHIPSTEYRTSLKKLLLILAPLSSGVTKVRQAEGAGSCTGLNNPLLAGNMASIFGSGLVLVLVSHIFPDKEPFNWEDFKTKITTSDAHVRTCLNVTLLASFDLQPCAE